MLEGVNEYEDHSFIVHVNYLLALPQLRYISHPNPGSILCGYVYLLLVDT